MRHDLALGPLNGLESIDWTGDRPSNGLKSIDWMVARGVQKSNAAHLGRAERRSEDETMTNVYQFPGGRTFDLEAASLLRHKFRSSLATRSVLAELVRATPPSGVLAFTIESLSNAAACSRAATFDALRALEALGAFERSSGRAVEIRWDLTRVAELAEEVRCSDVALTMFLSASDSAAIVAVENPSDGALVELWKERYGIAWARRYSPTAPPRRVALESLWPRARWEGWSRLTAYATELAATLVATVSTAVDRALWFFFNWRGFSPEGEAARLEERRHPLAYILPLLVQIDRRIERERTERAQRDRPREPAREERVSEAEAEHRAAAALARAEFERRFGGAFAVGGAS